MLTRIASLPLIQAPLLQAETWLHHGFGVKDVPIDRYLSAIGLNKAVLPPTKQDHGATIHIVTSEASLQGDAFLTDKPNTVCWVRTADCVPILLVDPKRRAVGAIHAGWRGTAQKIVIAAVKKMVQTWGSEPGDLNAAIGPAIGGHCYPVGEEVRAAFAEAGLLPALWMEAAWKDHWFLDLAFANLAMLRDAGVPRDRIYLSLACTACDGEKFSSYRREKGGAGRQVSFIVIR